MSVAIVTGSGGLIGSETVRFLHEKGLDVVGVDNDMRKYFFGEEASTTWKTAELVAQLPRFEPRTIDIRDEEAVNALFASFGEDIAYVVHTAAQPSHDWAAREPLTDFNVNATGTLVLLEATRKHCHAAPFLHASTNKVYGDTPNRLPLLEQETRWELDPSHAYAEHGIDESMSIDGSKHSLFGASKVAADVLAQEYGRYFGMNVGVFRGGCLTGPAHSAAELHGFLAYLAKCVVTGRPYTVFGYKGKQVRDNIHAHDFVTAVWCFLQNPRPGEAYNLGGARHSNCSVLEAITLLEGMCDKKLDYTLSDEARSGDHMWWISDVRKFQADYPEWSYVYDLERMVAEIVDVTQARSG